jgi:two-component system response regulator GlrR
MSSTTLPLPSGAAVVRLDRATGTLRERRYQAEVIDGPDRGTALVLQGTVRVGTHAEAQLRLTDPTASRYHLELDARDCGVLVRDLKSTNGTYLAGARVEQVLLERSSLLKVGQTTLRITLAESDLGAPREAPSFQEAVGQSAAMRRLFGLLTAVARSDATVVLLGETGTGKEVLARSIHRESTRRAKAFMVVDCSALPAGLAESELFGHLRGAFTGAVDHRLGAFLEADGGTLFLDEIGELPLDLQPKLLRVLETGMVKRVGENNPRRADVRIVAATHRDLEAEVAAGRFRADLFYRLSVVLARVPPLRDRMEDLPLLVRHLSAGMAPDFEWPAHVLEAWARHSWPGNVRELRNAVQRAIVLRAAGHAFEALEPLQAPAAASFAPSAPPPAPAAREDPGDGERRRIAEALARCAGNQTAAAKLLGISRRTLVTRLSTLGLPRPRKPTKPGSLE